MREAKNPVTAISGDVFQGRSVMCWQWPDQLLVWETSGVFRTWQRNMEEECSCWFIFF